MEAIKGNMPSVQIVLIATLLQISVCIWCDVFFAIKNDLNRAGTSS